MEKGPVQAVKSHSNITSAQDEKVISCMRGRRCAASPVKSAALSLTEPQKWRWQRGAPFLFFYPSVIPQLKMNRTQLSFSLSFRQSDADGRVDTWLCEEKRLHQFFLRYKQQREVFNDLEKRATLLCQFGQTRVKYWASTYVSTPFSPKWLYFNNWWDKRRRQHET